MNIPDVHVPNTNSESFANTPMLDSTVAFLRRHWLAFFLLALTVFRYAYIVSGPLELSGDEAQYWTWSRHLDLGYYTKAPMIAWLIALSTGIMGNTVLGVRLLAPLFALGLALMVYAFARQVHGSREAGVVAALLVSLTPVFFVGGTVMTTDVPMVTCWLLVLWGVWHALVRGATWGWYGAGLALGLGLLSKYNIGVLPVSLLVFLVFSSRWRPWLRTPHPYLAAMLAALILAPNLWWNATHHWVTVRATWGNVTGGQGGPGEWLTFLAGQVGALSPILFVLLSLGVWRALRERRGAGVDLLVWPSLMGLAFYAAKAWGGQVDTNWPVATYTGLVVAAAGPLAAGWAFWRRLGFGLAAVLLAMILSANTLDRAGLPLPPRWWVPFSQMRGWEPIARWVAEEGRAWQPAFVVSDFYQLSATLSFYLPGQPMVYYQRMGVGKGRAAQYDLWPGFENRTGENALLVLCGHWSKAPASWTGRFAACGAPRYFTARSDGVDWHTVTLVPCWGLLSGRDRLVHSSALPSKGPQEKDLLSRMSSTDSPGWAPKLGSVGGLAGDAHGRQSARERRS